MSNKIITNKTNGEGMYIEGREETDEVIETSNIGLIHLLTNGRTKQNIITEQHHRDSVRTFNAGIVNLTMQPNKYCFNTSTKNIENNYLNKF